MQTTFKKIFCATDFSPGAQAAMRVAVRVAVDTGAELVLAHAWYVPPVAFAGEYVFAPTAVQRMLDDAGRALETAVGEARTLGAKAVSSRLLDGEPGFTLVDALADDSFDLAVIGTHGRTGLARVLLGSVAEKVVRHAPCSVLVVHPRDQARSFQHVLCPIDFSDSSQHALDLAARLVRPGGAGLTLLHVLELPVSYGGEAIADVERRLDQRSAELLDTYAARLEQTTPVPVTKRTRIGSPGAQALAVLDDDPSFDLVVVGTHGRTGIKRALLGSVAEKIVRHASCPVLVARRR